MSETRGFWMALGVTLVPVGIAGMIAYRVAVIVAVPTQPFRWTDPSAVVCIASTLAGAAILALVLWGIRNARARARKVSGFLAEGNALLATIRAEKNDSRAAELEKQASNWATSVCDWLRGEIPELESLFLNEAGHGVQFSVSGRHAISRIENWVERRLTGLGQIALKVS